MSKPRPDIFVVTNRQYDLIRCIHSNNSWVHTREMADELKQFYKGKIYELKEVKI